MNKNCKYIMMETAATPSSPAKAAMLIVISQLAAAWLIELFGLFGMEKTDFTVRKLLGMAVAVVGIVVFQWE